jgi:hypothetical protein
MSLPNYPEIPFDVSSRAVATRSGRSIVTTTDGTVAQTLTHPHERLDFRVIHTLIHAAHWEALEQFYEDNRYNRFYGNFDGVERAFEFVARPLPTLIYRAGRQYTVDLREV